MDETEPTYFAAAGQVCSKNTKYHALHHFHSFTPEVESRFQESCVQLGARMHLSVFNITTRIQHTLRQLSNTKCGCPGSRGIQNGGGKTGILTPGTAST